MGQIPRAPLALRRFIMITDISRDPPRGCSFVASPFHFRKVVMKLVMTEWSSSEGEGSGRRPRRCPRESRGCPHGKILVYCEACGIELRHEARCSPTKFQPGWTGWRDAR